MPSYFKLGNSQRGSGMPIMVSIEVTNTIISLKSNLKMLYLWFLATWCQTQQ